MEFKKIKIDNLIHADYNPRKDLKVGDSEYEKIKKSIQEFGYVEPVIINKNCEIEGKYLIIGGHQRSKVLKELGYEEIDCVVIDVDKSKEKALNIALNKISDDWDEERLSKLLDELKIEEYNIELTGFEWSEAEKLWDEYIDKDEQSQDEEIPKVPEESVIQLGDIILLGKHRVICGDATNEEDIEIVMDNKSANLIVIDAPYGVSYIGKTEDALTIQNDNMEDEEFYDFLLKAHRNLYSIAGDGCSIYSFHADSKGHIFRKAFIDAGFKLSQCCVWVKNTFVLGRQAYQWGHEPALFGWKPTGAHYWNSDRKQSTVWNFDKPNRNAEHPTMKPLPLIEYIIKNSSKYGDLVVDTFLGSGSTLIACDKTDRICYGSELDPKYCEVIIQRWINYKEGISSADVIIERDGKKTSYKELTEESL